MYVGSKPSGSLTGLNLCYRRERARPYRNCKELQEHGRAGWRSKSTKKQIYVSPMCPRPILPLSTAICVSELVTPEQNSSYCGTQPKGPGWNALDSEPSPRQSATHTAPSVNMLCKSWSSEGYGGLSTRRSHPVRRPGEASRPTRVRRTPVSLLWHRKRKSDTLSR